MLKVLAIDSNFRETASICDLIQREVCWLYSVNELVADNDIMWEVCGENKSWTMLLCCLIEGEKCKVAWWENNDKNNSQYCDMQSFLLIFNT